MMWYEKTIKNIDILAVYTMAKQLQVSPRLILALYDIAVKKANLDASNAFESTIPHEYEEHDFLLLPHSNIDIIDYILAKLLQLTPDGKYHLTEQAILILNAVA